MCERPIIFSTVMVRAIVEGRKTQTRRVVKWPIMSESDGAKRRLWTPDDIASLNDILKERAAHPNWRPTPYRLGMRLWVRETWATTEQSGDHPSDAYPVYRATDPGWENMEGWRWRSPIHMPRWASRLTLEVEAVRVERLQDISEEDARDEGVYACHSQSPGLEAEPYYRSLQSPQRLFSMLWNSINAKRGFPWASNPWVFVIDFSRVIG